MKKSTKKEISKKLEQSVIDSIVEYKKNFTKCEACGEIVPKWVMECVAIDEEKAQALVCPKCYFGAEERADEHEVEAGDPVYDKDHSDYWSSDIASDLELERSN